jgi:peptidyl-prolyl cis-trans isomerase B (cyclophilin B)
MVLLLLAVACCAGSVFAENEVKKGATAVLVELKTSKGVIKLELNEAAAPKTVANFVTYVKSGHYNGTVFHRVIPDFMVQGGGFDASFKQKDAPNTVENEADNGLKNELGTVAMARTSDPHSAGAQFFINVKNNGFLNHSSKTQSGWGYCVFGKVTEGMDVVKEIEGVATGNRGHHQDVPKEDVLILEATVVE